MNTPELNHSIPPELEAPEGIRSPRERVGDLRQAVSLTEESFGAKTESLQSQIEGTRLSPEKKASYNEKAAQLFEKYRARARQLRDIAIVALVVSATSPAFAQEGDTEKLETATSASLTIKESGSTTHEGDIILTTEHEDRDSTAPASQEDVVVETPIAEIRTGTIDGPDLPLSELPDTDTTASIIMTALEAATKNQIEHAKQNPVETGAKLASKFLKGPLKYLGDVVEVGKGIQEGKYKNDTASDTALKVGKFLLDIKTLGLGSLVVDYLRAQKGQPE